MILVKFIIFITKLKVSTVSIVVEKSIYCLLSLTSWTKWRLRLITFYITLLFIIHGSIKSSCLGTSHCIRLSMLRWLQWTERDSDMSNRVPKLILFRVFTKELLIKPFFIGTSTSHTKSLVFRESKRLSNIFPLIISCIVTL